MDDFYSLQLDKMDRYVCLKKSEIIIPEGEVESSSDEDGSEEVSGEDEYDEDDETETLVGADEYADIKDYDKELERIDEDNIRVTITHQGLEIEDKMGRLDLEARTPFLLVT